MTAAGAEHQWFIARDGKQYGPVSESEMRKLVELGHLKAGDLVWRQGFADWQPAQMLLPQAPAPTPFPPVAVAPAAPQQPTTARPTAQPAATPTAPAAAAAAPYPAQPAATQSALQAAPQATQTGAAQPAGGGRDPARQELSSLNTAGRTPQRMPATPMPTVIPAANPAPAAQGQPHPTQPQWPQSMAPTSARAAQPTFGDAMRQTAPQPTAMPSGYAQPSLQPSPRPLGQTSAPTVAGPAAGGTGRPLAGPAAHDAPHALPNGAAPNPSSAVTTQRQRSLEALPPASDFEDEGEEEPRRGGMGRKLALAVVVLALAGGGGYVLSQGGFEQLTKTLRGAASTTKATTTTPAAATSKQPAAAIDASAVESRYGSVAMWAVVRREFPEWFGERMQEVAKLAAEKKPDEAVTKHLVEQLVALRRQNSDAALGASTDRLKGVASAFLTNLKALAAKSTDACYGFISQGETSPAAVQMFNQWNGTTIESQVVAIFEAIAEGRKARTAHNPPLKTDYDALADQLAKLGWSQGDLQMFADPRALAKATPDKVCQMVQDWFTAHIAITDGDVQERLLVETLRPVVAG